MTWLTPPLLWFEIVFLFLLGWCVHRFVSRPGSRIAALKDWVAYVGISVALVVAIFLAAIYGPKNSPVDWKWIGFAVNTLFVFGYTIKAVRPLWQRPRVWVVLTILVLLHGIAGWVVISRMEEIPTVWYVPIDMGEIWVALIAIQLACRAPLPPLHKT
jgi:hypothetical protein